MRFVYYNPNPSGKNAGDCTVRAIAKATGMSWQEAYLALAIQGYLDGDMPSANIVINTDAAPTAQYTIQR